VNGGGEGTRGGSGRGDARNGGFSLEEIVDVLLSSLHPAFAPAVLPSPSSRRRSRYTTTYLARYPDIRNDPYLPCRQRNEMMER